MAKAVVFDIDGTVLAVARRHIAQLMPKARHVERDAHKLWQATASAIRETLEKSGRKANDVAAVAATAHGDGIFLMDKNRLALGHGILSLDGRAGRMVLTS